MKKNYKIPFFLLLLLGIRIFSQFGNLTNVVPTTPEMSGLVKRVDIPVNYSSGAINYPLNIYTLKVKDLEIPITLNYTSTGFKLGENASNVGLGWDLEVGGKISHKVNGLDDLHSPKEYSVFPNGFPVDMPVKIDFVNPGALNYPEYGLLRDNSNALLDENGTFMRNPVNRIDTEPDIFHFSYPGKSSKFFLDKDFNGKQMPAGKEKIQFDGLKFIITDIQGDIYEYAVQDEITLQSDMVLLSGSCPYSGGNLIYNNYYLSKVRTKNGDIIDFLYDYVDYAYDNPASYVKGSTKDYYNIPEVYTSSFEVKYLSKVTQHTLPILKEIKVNTKTKISFEYKSTPRGDVKNNFARKISALDKIKIQEGGSSFTTVFEQSYFTETGVGDYITDKTAWLKLNSVRINDKLYSFKYYEDLMPGKDSENKDFWGYYSKSAYGRYNEKDFREYFYLGGKKPDLESSQTTLLKEIVYPTKGSDEFIYENNTYDELGYQEFSKKIISAGVYYSPEFDNGDGYTETVNFVVDKPTVFLLTYNIPFQPGGATAEANVTYDLRNNTDNTWFQFPGMSGHGQTEVTLFPGSYTLSMTAKGLPDPFVMLYAEETVKTYTGRKNLVVGGVRIGKIISKDYNGNPLFTKSINYNDENNISTGKIYDKPLVTELERGYTFKYYPEFCKVLDKYFNYRKYYSTTISDILGYNGATVFYPKVTESITGNGIDKGKTVYTFYDEDDGKLYYDTPYLLFNDNSWKRGFIKKQEIFEKGNPVPIKTITNDYSFIQTPSSKQIESGLDFTAPTKPNEFHKMSYQLFVTSPEYFLTCVPKNPAANFDFYGKKLVSAQVNKDREVIEENLNGKLLRTETEYFYNNPLHIQPTSQKIIFPDKSIQETTFQYAHEKGNQYLINKNIIGIPLETTVVKKTNSGDAGKTISKIISLYPNSDTEANNKTSGLPLPISISSLNVQSNTLTTDVLFKQYHPISGNLLQYNPKPDANGNSSNPVSIVWGYNNTLPIAKIEGANYEQVSSYISTIVGASDTDAAAERNNDETELLKVLNDFKNNPNLAGFQITTYTYDPLIGVRSITPPSGIREIYLYDDAGRLKEIREHNKTGKLLKEFNYHYKN